MKQIAEFLFTMTVWPLMITLGLAALWHFDVTMWVAGPVAGLTLVAWAAAAMMVVAEVMGSADGMGVFYTSKLIAETPAVAQRIIREVDSSLYQMGPNSNDYTKARALLAEAVMLIGLDESIR